MNRKINTSTRRKILRLPARRFMPVRRRLKRFTTLNNLDYNRARRSARRCVSSRISWDLVTREILPLLTWLNWSAQSYFKPLLVRWSTDDFIKTIRACIEQYPAVVEQFLRITKTNQKRTTGFIRQGIHDVDTNAITVRQRIQIPFETIHRGISREIRPTAVSIRSVYRLTRKFSRILAARGLLERVKGELKAPTTLAQKLCRSAIHGMERRIKSWKNWKAWSLNLS